MTEVEDEKNALRQLRNELARTGFSWVLLISTLLLTSMIAYHAIYIRGSGYSNLPNLALATLLFTCAGGIYIAGMQTRFRRQLWPLSAFVLTQLWIVLAYDLYSFWNDRTSAESILMFAFLVFMLAFHSFPRLLLASLPWLVLTNITILLLEASPESAIETIISLVTYPLIYIFSRNTIGRFYNQASEKYLENIRLINALKTISLTDELTGIGNRKAFNQHLELLTDLARRQSNKLSLVILDIDYFKQYNDALGHPAGDKCLQQVAKVLAQQCRRQTDKISRIGGEEFALILADADSQQAVQQVKQIRQALQQIDIIHPDSEVADQITISFGIAQYQSEDIEQFYKRADQALYQAKQNGRNRYSIAS